MRNIYLIALLIFMSVPKLYATHGSGADITYTRVGKDSFMIYVDLYKDCKGIVIAAPQVNVQSITGSYNAAFTLSQSSCKDVTNVCPGQCTKCLASSCNADGNPNGVNTNCSFAYGYEQVRFSGLLVLTNVAANLCSFRLSTTVVSRPAIGNCCASVDLYTYCNMERCLSNNSPKFLFTPDFVTYAGSQWCMNFLATDIDGDSLSYHMDTAMQAAATSCTYNNPYTFKYPFAITVGSSTFVIDSLKGSLCITPSQQQTGVVVVRVKEWRKNNNGKYINIGCIRRDHMVIIQAAVAGGNKSPIVTNSATVKKTENICVGSTYCFDIVVFDSNSNDTVVCEGYNLPDSAKFTHSYTQKNSFKSTLCWTPTVADISNTAYYLSFVVKDDHCPVPGKTNIVKAVYVREVGQFDSMTVVQSTCGDYTFTSWPTMNSKTTKWQFYGANSVVKYGSTVSLRFIDTGWIKYSVTKGYPGICDSSILDSVYESKLHLSVAMPNYSTLCDGVTTTVYPTVKGGTPPYRYLWLGKSSDTLDHFTFTPNGNGWIKVTVKDTNGCSYADSTYITTVAGVAGQKLQNVFMCGNNIKAIGFNMNSGFTYLWNTGDTNAAITPTQSGSYILKVSNSYGCSINDTFDVVVVAAPKSMLGNDTLLCSGNSLTLTADTTTGNFYQWSTGNSSKSITVSKSGTYTCTMSTANGCNTKDSVKVTVVNPVVINLGQNQTICKGDSVLLDAGAGFSNYTWNNGSTSQQIYAKQFGFYEIKALDSNLCNSQDNLVISWHPQTSLVVSGNKRFCPGSSTTLAAANIYASYLWNTGDTTQSISVTTAGNYTLSVIDKYGCSQSMAVAVIASPAANAAFQYQQLGSGVVSFKPNDTTNNAYTWYFGDNQTGFQLSPLHTYATTGSYTASLSVFSKDACFDSTAQILSVFTGLNAPELLQNFNIIPNPAVGEAMCIWQLGKTSQVMAELLDLSGKRIAILLNEKQSQGQHQLYLKAQEMKVGPGVYMLRLTAGGQQATLKLMWY